ncbi:MAG: hypothetical protein HGB00_06900 [Chlorobiaceae bacterium]|nr:hypothetical protein [Chlorobiaceae bacterium]
MINSSQIKGALFEYLIRRLLLSCRFNVVKPDGHYIFRNQGLFFINGKGAAHDADVLMDPPIQMPFSYPSRILFECKAYSGPIGVNVLRGALGLRWDINDFEIVTDDTIIRRKNNRRSQYAISNRSRYLYNVGVASIFGFSKPAIEFAANNKIPLLSLKWFLPDSVCRKFQSINDAYIVRNNTVDWNDIYIKLKDKSVDSDFRYIFDCDEVIRGIVSSFDNFVRNAYIALLESGDMILLVNNEQNSFEDFVFDRGLIKAQIYYDTSNNKNWELVIPDSGQVFNFYLPKRIMSLWGDYSFDSRIAINFKNDLFSRIFVFKKNTNTEGLPFVIINLDREWFDRIQAETDIIDQW